jgi:hypothetical protein
VRYQGEEKREQFMVNQVVKREQFLVKQRALQIRFALLVTSIWIR